jgi:hypothetical protein
MSRPTIAALSLAASVMTFQPALAGQYDGKWVVDFPAPQDNLKSSSDVCSAFRLVVAVKDNQLEANLQREATSLEVENSTAANAVPVKGSVAPDGTVIAKWENFPVIGRLTGNVGAISVQGDCGPRTGRAVRVE